MMMKDGFLEDWNKVVALVILVSGGAWDYWLELAAGAEKILEIRPTVVMPDEDVLQPNKVSLL